MHGVQPHRPPTTLDVLEHVLDKGVVIDTRSDTPDVGTDVSIAGLRLLGVDARVVVEGL